MPTEGAYSRVLRWQLPRLCEAVQGTGARLVIGIPTYDEWSASHFPAAETPAAALRGIGLGLDAAPHAEVFDGISVYAEWTTDDAEWAVIRDSW